MWRPKVWTDHIRGERDLRHRRLGRQVPDRFPPVLSAGGQDFGRSPALLREPVPAGRGRLDVLRKPEWLDARHRDGTLPRPPALAGFSPAYFPRLPAVAGLRSFWRPGRATANVRGTWTGPCSRFTGTRPGP